MVDTEKDFFQQLNSKIPRLGTLLWIQKVLAKQFSLKVFSYPPRITPTASCVIALVTI